MTTHVHLQDPNLLVIDYGSQLSSKIPQQLRRRGIRCALLQSGKKKFNEKVLAFIREKKPKGIILSGSGKSVSDGFKLPLEVLDAGVPVLGICFGHQLLADYFGGVVTDDPLGANYGPTRVSVHQGVRLFKGVLKEVTMWCSHGDSVSKAPDGFQVIARDRSGGIQGLRRIDDMVWTVQFHPEAEDSQGGADILENFARDICGCETDWDVVDVKDELIRSLSGLGVVLSPSSGGVDSSVTNTLLARAPGTTPFCVCLDVGHLRKGERQEIIQNLRDTGNEVTFIGHSDDLVVDAPPLLASLKRGVSAVARFVGIPLMLSGALDGLLDSEAQREAFRNLYNFHLVAYGKSVGATKVVQGTLYPDMIESGKTGGETIKTHHNAGGNWGKLEEIHPLQYLFKDEVREIARALGLPESISEREPFPGPGLLLRIFGGYITRARLELVREADAIVRGIIDETRAKVLEFPVISQLVTALNCAKTVGLKGDKRAYEYSICVRGVRTVDYMTAEGVQLPPAVRVRITTEITKLRGVCRVMFDETPKPSGTTEYK